MLALQKHDTCTCQWMQTSNLTNMHAELSDQNISHSCLLREVFLKQRIQQNTSPHPPSLST